MTPELLELAANTIKGLSMDAVQRANSGHPGMPMGMADLAVSLWSQFLTVDPDDQPEWPTGTVLCSRTATVRCCSIRLLHLAGFPVSLDDIRNSASGVRHTAGHPEIEPQLGIEMTTGPLGQGFGTGVGMAIAEAHLRARLGTDLVDHRHVRLRLRR